MKSRFINFSHNSLSSFSLLLKISFQFFSFLNEPFNLIPLCWVISITPLSQLSKLSTIFRERGREQLLLLGMAEDQFQSSGGGNWWDAAARNNMRYESGGASQSSSSGITNIGGGGGGGNNNFANWQQQQQQDVGAAAAAEHMKPTTRSSMDSSGGGGGGSSVVFHHHDPHKLHPPDHSATSSDPNLHMMGLGLSSPSSLDWDQPSLLRGEKGAENSFRSMLQENLGSSRTNFQQDHHHHHQSGGGMGLSPQQVQWRDPSSTTNNNNRGFSLDQNQFSPQYSSGESTVTSQQGLHHHHHQHPSISSPFQNIDSSALYGSPSSILMQGLLGPDQNSNNRQANNNSMNFPFPPMSYGLSSNSGSDLVPSNSWPNNNKAPQFLRGSTPPNNQLHFTNNAPFWNASEASATIKDVRSTGFFPSLQPSFSTTPNFDVQSKNMSEVRDSGGVVKKSGSEQTPKRPRNETPSPLPAFKVRKEKMGDRITALQQLVSPFGKTDTASVLSEAIEYIKFLHEQVTVLSTPYIKSGAPIQIQQNSGKSKEGEGPKQDLRSRGLCLVPVSSTFPVTHETTVDFWTPTFGGGTR